MAEIRKADSKASTVAPIHWRLPGAAIATVFFKDTKSFKTIFVALMPGTSKAQRVEATIGDEIVSDDFMDIDGFEPVFLASPDASRYVRATFVNRSQVKSAFELVFVFSDDLESEQKYEIEMEAMTSLTIKIPVLLIP